MAIESNLPENVNRRVSRQLLDAEKQTKQYRETLWFLEQAQAVFRVPMPTSAADPVTTAQIATAVKCVQADLLASQRLEDSARAIYNEYFGIEDEPEEQADPVRDGWVGKDGRP